MEQNKKPDKPLNPHLADLIGDYIISPADTARFKRWWEFVAGSPKRRAVSGSALGLVSVALLLNFLALTGTFTLGRTQLAGVTVQMKQSDTDIKKKVNAEAANYAFSIAYPDGKTKNYKLADAGITINDDASVQQLRQEVRHLGWQRFAWWKTTSVPLTIVKNNKKLDAFTASNIAIINQPAKDATLTVKSGKAVITDGVNGSTHQIAGGNKQLVTAATTLKPLRAKLEPTAVEPAIQRKNLEPAVKKVSGYTEHSVSFILGDRTITATPTEIGNWLDIEAVPAKKTVDVTLNSGKIQAYVDKITATSIYPAKAQIMTTDASGAVTVLASGRNGSAVANKSVVVKTITNQLQQQDSKVITANLEITHESYKTINAADYPKWMVADVRNKRMYAYEHNQLVRTFLISAGAPKTPTVIGTYKIYSKIPIKTMRGANADGSRYVQPDVKYVNYFYKDYAIHGNYWRPTSYFGNVNSSHGCIGITNSDAEWIYNWAPIGTTVITHE